MYNRRRRRAFFPLFIILGIGAVILFGWIVMLLWNAIIVPAAGAHLLTFWQGLGLLVLSRILVGGFGGGGRRGRRGFRGQWNTMTPEEKENLKQQWKQRCGGGEETTDAPVGNA